ncbi:MAG: hypothetical protein XE08_0285 [Parcubacteria bacterium 32_520]|nr:MAG: hypothetical protein XD75_0566 [Parcubacteria bacterium 33_209]KUK99012.1 MAG: hypothetical protein XE08_0285 [Parcubacteria bacterium 32_520]
MAYTDLKTIIKEKLEALKDDNENTLIKEVFIFDSNKPSGYPYATVVQSISEGEIIDNTRVERIYEISVKVFQEISEGGKSNEEAMELITILEDKIIDMFDNDRQLTVKGVPSCDRVDIVSVRKDYGTNESPYIILNFEVRCRKIINKTC